MRQWPVRAYLTLIYNNATKALIDPCVARGRAPSLALSPARREPLEDGAKQKNSGRLLRFAFGSLFSSDNESLASLRSSV